MSVATTSQEEFMKLLEPVLGLAYRVAMNYTRSKEDAMDLVQDASVLAFKSFHTFQGGSNFKAWFMRILTNRYLKTRARKRPESVAIEDVSDVYLFQKSRESGMHGNPDDPARLVLDGLQLDQVQQAMETLPEEYRTTAVLYFLNDFSYEQIAEVLEIPVGTVRSRLHRGRKLLQKALWDVAVANGIVTEKGGSHA
ncbi:MAG: sigma-70 family RNA polymerase sigma factor [Armatimonadetes bacterium]|nr:sigma-70 family RNA polymerase sigma factor [Armatimonadota bacterium]